MKVLMISLDKSILDPRSETIFRIKSYGTICDELHIVILGKQKAEEKLSPNVFIYSTGSAIKFLSPLKAYRIGKKILLKFGDAPKIITTQDPFETGLIGWLLAKRFKIGLEAQMHGDFYGNNYWRKEKPINLCRHYLGKFVLRRADAVRVVSERIGKSVSGFTRGKIYKIPVYANTEGAGDVYFLKNRFSGAYPIILAVGNLAAVKNHKLLIEVFKEVKKELPRAKLVIVGDGPLKKSLQIAAHSLQLEEDVWLAGHQTNLADYYASADIFVHPSLYEGWGRAVIEAAYFGLPIIMTDVGLAGEVIENNESGLVVPANDNGALKAAILRLASDGDLRKKMAECAKKTVEKKIFAKQEFLDGLKRGWESVLK